MQKAAGGTLGHGKRSGVGVNQSVATFGARKCWARPEGNCSIPQFQHPLLP